jgi:hypothetical protein
METQEIAKRLVELCRKGDYEQAHEELYADNVVSIEPEGAPGEQKVVGREGLQRKAEQFQDMIEEYHGTEVSDPVVGDRFISLSMSIDATMKGMGRQKMDEICVYEVQDGKIVKEQFFYTVEPQ